ncbi:MAG TPA: uroporphyrinogen decarboxylase, partial [Ardenticatenaceae bacterium]|nr:uroporphyrinogen decarboxylase [Ardenticatenaceae bacterium]
MSDRFLRACRREPVDVTPVWFMRQAGRYLPEYRQLRERYPILELIRTPELAVEVALQPLRRFDLDAAIIFADILPPLIGMGIELEFAKGEGPVIHNPVRTPSDVDALRVPPPEENVPFTLEALRMARRELDGKVPLIGFSGAPFTLASYMIEGGSSRNYLRTKGMMYSAPEAWHTTMDKLARLVGDYLRAQVRAGAQAVQLFDSWAGCLSPADYCEYVLPYTHRVLAAAKAEGAPVIHFSTDTAGIRFSQLSLAGQDGSGPQTSELLKTSDVSGSTLRAGGADVIGVDWRVDLDVAWAQLGH